MYFTLLTPNSTPIFKYIVWILGKIMEGLFFVLDKIGIPNIGIAIILFTIFVNVCLIPLTYKQQKFSKLSLKMNPEIKAIQKKYNGKKDQPERQVLRMSDAYDGDGDIEVKVTMLNINYGKNKDLMDACEPLKEYAWLVDAVRRKQGEKMDLDAAVDAALEEMPDTFLIKPFLLENRAEVKSMFLTEYNEEKTLKKEREEGIDQARIESIKTVMQKLGYTIQQAMDFLDIPAAEQHKYLV